MRVISFLLRSALLLTILGVVGFLVAREVLLFLGMTRIRESITSVRSLRLGPGSIAPQCESSALTDPTQAIVEQLQIAFTSDTDFNVQIVCQANLRAPVTVASFELPPFVKKVPGTSGLIWGPGTTGVTLEVWGRRRSVVVDSQQVSFENGYLPQGIGTGPMASCSGYGFRCCPSDSSVGEGLQTSLVNDCPRSCFSQCVSRPVVLSLTTVPFFDLETRVVTIASGEQVTFNYVVDPGPGLTSTSTLDFGDGDQDTSVARSHTVSHTYTCATSNCEYPAQLLVKDSRGVDAANTVVSRVVIRVSGS